MFKYLKYVVITVLFCAAILVSTEIYKLYCTDFGQYDHVEMEDLENGSLHVRLEKINNLLSSNKLNYFIVFTVDNSWYDTDVNIYASEEIQAFLEEEEARKEGTFNGIFSGTVTVKYDEISDLTDVEKKNCSLVYYILDENINYLELEYEPDYLQEKVQIGEKSDYVIYIYCIWLVVLLVIIILSAFEAHLSKKELFLKISSGYYSGRLLTEKIFKRYIGYGLAFGFACLIFREYLCFCTFGKREYITFGLAIIVDILIMAWPHIRFDCREVLRKDKASDRILTLNYLIRITLVTVSIFLLSVSVEQVSEYIDMAGDKEFLSRFEGYRNVLFESEFIESEEGDEEVGESYGQDPENVACDFVKAYSDDVLLLNNCCSYETVYEKDGEAVFYNGNAEQFLFESIPEFENFEFENGMIYIIMPEGITESDIEEFSLGFIQFLAASMSGYEQVEFLNYSGDATAFIIDSGEGISRAEIKNPVFVFCSGEEWPETSTGFASGSEILNYSYVRITEDELKEYVASDDRIIGYQTRDIYKEYLDSLELARKQCVMWICVSVLFMALEIMIVITVLKMEHSMNALELCVKKVNGTPLIFRYDRMLLGSVVSCVLGVGAATFMMYEERGMLLHRNLIIGLLLLVIEFIISAVEIIKWENRNAMKILKGGCL